MHIYIYITHKTQQNATRPYTHMHAYIHTQIHTHTHTIVYREIMHTPKMCLLKRQIAQELWLTFIYV